VQKVMDEFRGSSPGANTLFEYVGAPDAERVIVLMGSGCEAAHETVEHLVAQGRKVGLSRCGCIGRSTANALSRRCRARRKIAVLDRTKEPGATGRTAVSGLRHGDSRGNGQRLGQRI
jgi:pyruvate-ferredoxin/flavodoxin oxidoreductase